MANCNPSKLQIAPFKHRQVEAGFSGGEIASDGGVLLLMITPSCAVTCCGRP